MLHFTKMQSVGNDYVVLDAFADQPLPNPESLADLAPTLCDRHFGIGADGLILLAPPAPNDTAAAASMTIINADGSPGAMCGNGLRCAAKLLVDRNHAQPDAHNRITVRIGERLAVINVHLDDDRLVEAATVDMGPPVLEPDHIPVEVTGVQRAASGSPHTFAIDDVEFVALSMGNPHAVVFTDQPDRLLFDIGPAWEAHRAFPDRTNVHFVQVVSRDEAFLLSWERGVGHTLGCGSGACAAVVAGNLTDRLDRQPVIRMPGGEVVVRWDEPTNHVFLTGPAEQVFLGRWPD